MPIYKCEKCNKEFKKKSPYAIHTMRTSSCIKDTNTECSYCNKIFSLKHNLTAHLKICKEKPIIDEVTQSQIEELKKMFERKFEEQERKFEEQLKKKIEELSHLSDHKEMSQKTEGILPSGNIPSGNNNITITENSNNNNINNNNITNNINIYSMGKEDLSILSNEDVVKICTSGTFYPIVAAQILHCNEKYPEFQNCLIPNLRSNTGLVKINDNWVSKSHDEIFRTILKVDKSHVSSLIKDLEVDKKLKVKLESTQDEIDTGESKEHQIPKIKENLYNSAKMIKQNKSKEDKLLIK
jgi:DNA-directed RNA polymerase subunit RPC12/RpoP